MYHECKVYCHSMTQEQAEILNITDSGKWLPFTIYLGCINAFKMSTDEEEDSTTFCTTVYTDTGDIYILDTPYKEFNKIWKRFIDDEYSPSSSDDEGDLNL
jgi:hypothetical protein